MLPYLIAGAIGFGIGKLFEEGGETFGRGGMTNEDILRSFLTSEIETQTNNLATFYSTLGDVMLLRNYGTLIAKRMGRRVEITNVKYSKTTSAITNRLKALAEEMGYNVSYVDKFAGGGEIEAIHLQATNLDKKGAESLSEILKKYNKSVRIEKGEDGLYKVYTSSIGGEDKFAGGGGVRKYGKGGLFGESAKLEYVDDAFASDELKSELQEKLGISSNDLGDNVVISFAYTDYGGDFLDKVAIRYFQENYPENTLVENTSYFGQNAYVFGEPAKEWIETTEDYPLGFENIEELYYEMQNESEYESFEYFLDDLQKYDGYVFDKDEVMSWLMENKGGYYSMTTQGLDFSSSDLTEELVNEDLIEKIDDDKYAGGGRIDKMDKFISELAKKNTKKFSVNEYHDFRNKKYAIGVARHYFTDNDGSFYKFDTKLGDALNIDFETQGDSNEYAGGGKVKKLAKTKFSYDIKKQDGSFVVFFMYDDIFYFGVKTGFDTKEEAIKYAKKEIQELREIVNEDNTYFYHWKSRMLWEQIPLGRPNSLGVFNSRQQAEKVISKRIEMRMKQPAQKRFSHLKFNGGGKAGEKSFADVYDEVVKYIMTDQNVSYDEAVAIIDEENGEVFIKNMVEFEEVYDAEFIAEQILSTDEGKYAGGGRITKYVTLYFVQGNYGQGFEDLTAHDNRKDAISEMRVYDDNESYPHRVIERRVLRSDYEKGNYAEGGEAGKKGKLNATYIPKRNIKTLTTTYGNTIKGKDLLDGAYTTRKDIRQDPKMVRTIFEEEEFAEFNNGGGVGSSKNEKIMLEFREEISDLRNQSYPRMSLGQAVQKATDYMSSYTKEELIEAIKNDKQIEMFGMESTWINAVKRAKKSKMENGGGVGKFKVGDNVTFNQDPSGRLSNNIYRGTILEINNGMAKISHQNSNMKDVIRNVNVANIKKFDNGGEAKKRRKKANAQIGKTDRSVDKTRVAKPVGYRFTNALASKLRKDKYEAPTEEQVKKYIGKGIYKENRKNRSDKDRTIKL
jgi:hypothetical protein